MSERPWDEYEWERFLQEQDRKTEHYMELLEKYMDHPNRDEIIAREMGWTHLLDENGVDWTEEACAFLDGETLGEEEEAAEDLEGFFDAFERHPLYQAAFALTAVVDQIFEELPVLQNHPAAVRLATQAAIGSAKLAAALSDDDVDEIGMTLAYLKRSLKAVSTSLEAMYELQTERVIDDARADLLGQHIFRIRDGIIEEMGNIRAEWRRRHGA